MWIHIIISILLLLIELDILFGLDTSKFVEARFPVRVYHIILLGIGNLPFISYFTATIFFVGLIFDFGGYYDLYLTRGVIRKILDKLNKPINTKIVKKN